MKKIITVALLCAPLAHAAYFAQETVSFDEDRKPIIQAQLILPPITATANVDEPYSPFSLFDDDEPFAKPTLIDSRTPEMIAQEKIAQATKEQVAAEKVAIAAKKKLEDEKAKFIALKRAQEKLKIAQAKKAAAIAAEIKRNASIYTMAKGQNYYDVLTSWLAPLVKSAHNTEKLQYNGITWQLPLATIEKLKNQQAVEGMRFNKKLAIAVNEMGASIDTDLSLTLNNDYKVAVIAEHDVAIFWIHGTSLKNVVENLAAEFGWNWLDEGSMQSWLAGHDFPFSSEYPIAVKAGEFDTALDSVIDGYPIQAKLLHGTRTIFITDK
ncbi:hypothetical protein [Moritella viscosa]|uniref:Toxin co-regulated pilus biosynthesis protein Q C-terminal domain-containing protein n=1 Tax=Moritella viscosa TaxID=80854 RepID=A0ABY1HI53_9GAMM|nr:hypothetical protein [Moritella viscosa]SGZ00281.1 Putative uncharacterized protein [Moritella viscosa]